MKKKQTIRWGASLLWFGLMFFVMLCSEGFTQERYVIDPTLSHIKGSIKYTVVGRYTSVFDEFEGEFIFDPDKPEVSSVTLKIVTGTLHSNFPRLDDIVRSKQLLDVDKFPQTVFQSTEMTRGEKQGEYFVTGDLTLHGVTKEISFPFYVEGPSSEFNNAHVKARGEWVINRKDFGIYWHPFLDKAGILVGNHMTVNWEIVAFK